MQIHATRPTHVPSSRRAEGGSEPLSLPQVRETRVTPRNRRAVSPRCRRASSSDSGCAAACALHWRQSATISLLGGEREGARQSDEGAGQDGLGA